MRCARDAQQEEEKKMNVLLIPATDWLHHPVPSRLHHIFETMAETDNVHVLQFDLYPENKSMETNVTIHRPFGIPSKDLSKYYLLNFPFYSKKVAKIIRSESIDVVVISNLLPGVPALVSKFSNVKVVFDLKDLFQYSAAAYYQGVSSSIVKGFTEWLLVRILKKSDLVVTVSLPLVDYLRGMSIHNVEFISNGVDLSIFQEKISQNFIDSDLSKNLAGNKNVIGFVGLIENWLDFDTVLAAVKQVSSEINDLKFLVVGGKVRTKYFESIKEYVKTIGLQNNVIFTGTVPHEEVPQYLNLMSGCLIPFRTDLPLSHVALPDKLFEYLACGKPVISTRLPEVIRVAKDAVRIYDDVASLSSLLTNLLSDGALLNSMQKAALENVKDYGWRSIARRYRKLLLDLI
jgi:glycosyltransferase involved in cell wall biosynthesis